MSDHPYGSFDPTEMDIRLHATWGTSNPETGASVHVEWGLDRPRDESLEDQLEALFPDSWRFRYKWYRPVERLPPGAPPPEWRAEILGGLRRRLTARGIAGVDQFEAFPTGWIWIAQVEYGRVLTLSDEMYALFERDPAALQDRMYQV